MYFFSAAVIILASLALIFQVSLPVFLNCQFVANYFTKEFFILFNIKTFIQPTSPK